MTEFETTLKDGREVLIHCEGEVLTPESDVGAGWEVKNLKILGAYHGETSITQDDDAWDEIEQAATDRLCDEYEGVA